LDNDYNWVKPKHDSKYGLMIIQKTNIQ